MKKLKFVSLAVACIFSFAALINNAVLAQTIQKTKPIPDDVLRIANKSCVNCHAEPGKKMALSHVNLTKWNSYTEKKQASKAGKMCKMVSKSKMPPKSFKKEYPGFVISNEEIKTICDWSASLQVAEN